MSESFDSLPERKLKIEEVRVLREKLREKHEQAWISIGETKGTHIDVLIIDLNGEETVLHYTQRERWHSCGEVVEHPDGS
jgi:hypothetical protein